MRCTERCDLMFHSLTFCLWLIHNPMTRWHSLRRLFLRVAASSFDLARSRLYVYFTTSTKDARKDIRVTFNCPPFISQTASSQVRFTTISNFMRNEKAFFNLRRCQWRWHFPTTISRSQTKYMYTLHTVVCNNIPTVRFNVVHSKVF